MSNVINRRRGTIQSSSSERAPRPGENFVRSIPDDQRGIMIEAGRMVQYVRTYRSHPLIVRTARRIVELCRAKDKMCEMNAIFLWVKGHFRYVNDPVGHEVTATPLSSLREIMAPPDLLEKILGKDLIRQMEGFGVGESLLNRTEGRIEMGACFRSDLGGKVPVASGDCDESSVFLSTLLAAVGIVPRFRFGGQEDSSVSGGCAYHHVWVQARNEAGEWIDMDPTENHKLGWFFDRFGCYGIASIF